MNVKWSFLMAPLYQYSFTNETKQIFMCFGVLVVFFLANACSCIFAHFLGRLLSLSLLSQKNSLYVLHDNSVIHIVNIFLSLWFAFSLCDVIWCADVLSFNIVKIIHLSFMICAFNILFKECSPKEKDKYHVISLICEI